MSLKSSETKVVSAYILFLLAIGILVLPTVGIAWDEPAQRLNAGVSIIEVAKEISPSLIPENYLEFTEDSWIKNAPVDHGVAFDAPVLVLEHLLGLQDARDIYVFHHIMNYLAFLVGTFAIFLIARFRFKSWKLGLLSSTIFFLSPRIFADAFYNSKDITFMCFLALSSYFVTRFLILHSRRAALFAGLIGGFATDIRVLGVVQIPIVIFIGLFLIVSNKEKYKKLISLVTIYLVAFMVSIYIFYPHIWKDPINRFWSSFQSLSKYNWQGKNRYFGNDIMASDLPWHYLPTWMGITTPLLYILFFLIGLLVIARYLWPSLTNESVTEAKLQDSFYTLMFFVPLAAIILLNATLYDGWRHAFFIYPYFVVITTIGVVFIRGYFSRKKLGSKVFYSCFIGYFVWIGGWMVVNNPHQNLYFNILSGNNLSTRWEMDYWGLSNKYALEYILKNDPSSAIKVREISFTPLEVSGKILDTKSRERLIFNVPIGDADYLVNNYRLTTKMVSEKETLGFNKVKDFKIDGEVFLTIYKRDNEKASSSGN